MVFMNEEMTDGETRSRCQGISEKEGEDRKEGLVKLHLYYFLMGRYRLFDSLQDTMQEMLEKMCDTRGVRTHADSLPGKTFCRLDHARTSLRTLHTSTHTQPTNSHRPH